MSKFDDLYNKLSALEDRLSQIEVDREEAIKAFDEDKKCVEDEIANIKEMIDIVRDIVDERKEEQEEAVSTLYTKSASGQKLHDDDFRECCKQARIDYSGFLSDPEPEENPRIEEIEARPVEVA